MDVSIKLWAPDQKIVCRVQHHVRQDLDKWHEHSECSFAKWMLYIAIYSHIQMKQLLYQNIIECYKFGFIMIHLSIYIIYILQYLLHLHGWFNNHLIGFLGCPGRLNGDPRCPSFQGPRWSRHPCSPGTPRRSRIKCHGSPVKDAEGSNLPRWTHTHRVSKFKSLPK